jgi:hypothetical protein
MLSGCSSASTSLPSCASEAPLVQRLEHLLRGEVWDDLGPGIGASYELIEQLMDRGSDSGVGIGDGGQFGWHRSRFHESRDHLRDKTGGVLRVKISQDGDRSRVVRAGTSWRSRRNPNANADPAAHWS